MLIINNILQQQLQQHKRIASSIFLRHHASSTIPIPNFIRAKELGRRVGQSITVIAKEFCVRDNRKFYFEHEGKSYKFQKAKDIVLPYAAVERWLRDGKCHGKMAALDLVEPDSMPPSSPAIRINSVDTSSDIDGDDIIVPTTPTVHTRNPVIAVMGHIDHGKTSLLDTLSGGNIAKREVENITQTINVCETPITPTIHATFLDTPGHFHFHRMRNNAANLADMVLLLVSLEEGCGIQTRESIGAIEELELPVIVCLNKMDIANRGDVEDVTADLRMYAALENAPMIPISALDRSSLAPLLDGIEEMIRSSSSAVELVSPALSTVSIPRGVVLEVRDVRGAGLVHRVLIQEGKINQGDHFVCGFNYGRIRKLSNINGETVDSGTPGKVVDIVVNNITGEKEAPLEMDFHIVTRKHAERIVELRNASREFAASRIEVDGNMIVTQETNLTETQLNSEAHECDDEVTAKPIIVKADSAGTLVSILDTLEDLPGLQIVHVGIGEVTPKDLAYAGDEVPIYCFKVGMPHRLIRRAEAQNVSIRKHSTVHDLIAHVESYAGEPTQ